MVGWRCFQSKAWCPIPPLLLRDCVFTADQLALLHTLLIQTHLPRNQTQLFFHQMVSPVYDNLTWVNNSAAFRCFLSALSTKGAGNFLASFKYVWFSRSILLFQNVTEEKNEEKQENQTCYRSLSPVGLALPRPPSPFWTICSVLSGWMLLQHEATGSELVQKLQCWQSCSAPLQDGHIPFENIICIN